MMLSYGVRCWLLLVLQVLQETGLMPVDMSWTLCGGNNLFVLLQESR